MDDLTHVLQTLDWSRRDLQQRLGVHRNTMIPWFKGEAPQYVWAYLELASRLDLIRGHAEEVLESANEPERSSGQVERTRPLDVTVDDVCPTCGRNSK